MLNVWTSCKCGSGDITIFERYSEENKVIVKARCNDCGDVFMDIYEYKYIGRKYLDNIKIFKNDK